MWSSNNDTRENDAVANQVQIAPRLLSIELVGAAYTKAGSVQFMVQFSARVSDLGVGHFRLATSGNVSGTLASVLRLGGDACLVTVDDVSGAGKLALALRTEAFAGGIVADLPENPAYTIDRLMPTVKDLTAPVSGRYRVGQHLDFGVAYDVPICVKGGKPDLTVSFPCGRSVQAKLLEIVGAQMIFRHTIADAEIDVRSVAWARSINLNGAVIQDGAGNHADVMLRCMQLVSGDVSAQDPHNQAVVAANMAEKAVAYA